MNGTAYPRPDGRGPIEAAAREPMQPRTMPSIRDLTVAAPLKPQLPEPHAPDRSPYPRPDGRGPIEADPLRSPRWSSQPSIRDLTVAAPLKREAGSAGPLPFASIRDLTVAAPLKPRRPIHGLWQSSSMTYPRPDGRGPIEAYVCVQLPELRCTRSLSAT